MRRLVPDRLRERMAGIEQLRAQNLYTFFLEMSSASRAHVRVAGKDCVNFISNNYLGFSTHPKVTEAVTDTLQEYGLGVGGAPIACGSTDVHYALMAKIAQLYEAESAALFATGYMALMGTIQALVGCDDRVLVDSLVHRSIIDGAILSGAERRSWLHNDMDDLRELLSQPRGECRQLIVVDSVYSMEGDMADLPGLCQVRDEHDAILLIDEAHALGVIGPRGYGLMDHFGLPGSADVVAGTFSKFAGATGGFVAGPADFIDYLRHHASPYLFSASIAPFFCAGILKSFELIDEEPEWRDTLWANIRMVLDGLGSLGFDTGAANTPVVPVFIRDPLKTMVFNRKLLDQGVYATPIVHPAVPPGQSRIRLGIMATHSTSDLERCLEAFARAGRELDLIP